MAANPHEPSLEIAFDGFLGQLHHLVDYGNAVAPVVHGNPKMVAELRDAMIVLLVARLDWFYQSLLSLAVRHREADIRALLVNDRKPEAASCSMPALVRLIRRKVKFKDDARVLDNTCRRIFGCSVWPNDQVRDVVLDLVHLRNMIVHVDGHDWSQDGVHQADLAGQFRGADVLDGTRYGQFVTYSVNSMKAMVFMRAATVAIVEQVQYLRARIVDDTAWVFAQ